MQKHFRQARENMIESQILPNKVTDEALLAAMRGLSREKFLPAKLQGMAYTDEDIAVGNGRYMTEPVVLARLLQAAGVRKTDNVLDIGCGTGYAAALLGLLGKSVTGLERDKSMAAEAARILEEAGIGNVRIIQTEDLKRGFAEKAPYDAILINGAVAEIPAALRAQLGEGGRLVTVVAKSTQALRGTPVVQGRAVRVIKRNGGFIEENLFDASTPFLTGFEPPKSFVF